MAKHPRKDYPSLKEVTQGEHITMVKDIFSTITGRYDFLNHLLSLRRDVAWRRFTVKKMRFFNTFRFLDLACGTADLALMSIGKYPGISVIGIDFVQEMLIAGKRKIKKKDQLDRIKLVQGDAIHLPFNDNSFDVAGIAFGIRNIPNRVSALKEMVRVVVPGGQIVVLEMAPLQNPLLKNIYYACLKNILPSLAARFSKNPAAYLYLADSIMNFPIPVKFAGLMEETGIEDVRKYKLTLGITYLYTGIKPRQIPS